MKRPDVIEGAYVSGRRTLEYWTSCEHCKERKECKHTCDHPGNMHFLMAGKRSVQWQGIITIKKIANTVKKYLECEEAKLPEDVYVPPRQMTFEEIRL